MYKKFFGLADNPFNASPDPRYWFLTEPAQEALACLTYGIQRRRGFILLTGEVGTGKTTLLNKLLGWLRQYRVATSYIFNPGLDPGQFVDYMLADFGLNCGSQEKGRMLQHLNKWLLDRYRVRGTAVLIVDEAQNLTPEVLEEIRLLTNLETSTEKLLQIVLSGQSELEEKLNRAELRQLRQRITLRCRTYPLTHEETRHYIMSRLRIAGSNGHAIFTPEAMDAVHSYARGVPRVINLLCEHGLIGGFAQQKNPVPVGMIHEAAHDFQLDTIAPVAEGARAPADDSQRLMDALQTIATFMGRLRPQR
jgi:general secretion pathway protein A